MRKPLNFDAMITEGAKQWRTVERGIDDAEKLAAAAGNDPAALAGQALMAFAFVRVKQEKLQTYLRERFGIEVDDPIGREAPELSVRVVDEERACGRYETLEDVAEETDVVVILMMYNTAWWAMLHAMRVGTLAWLAKEPNARWWARFGVACPVLPPSLGSSVALAVYFYVLRTFPIMYAPLMQHTPDEPSGLSQLRGAAVGMLAALVRSQLKVQGRLRGALATEGKPQEVLLRELPGAVAEELGRLNAAAAGKEEDYTYLEDLHKIKDDGRRDVIRVLTNRVARQITARMGKEASPGPEQSKIDEDLEQFEQDETLRQLTGPGGWVERAQLSEQQKRVHDLDMETDHDTKAIARTLGITPGQVRKVRHDYVAKIRKAAGF